MYCMRGRKGGEGGARPRVKRGTGRPPNLEGCWSGGSLERKPRTTKGVSIINGRRF